MRGQIQLGLAALISTGTAAAACLVFYFCQLITLHTGITANAVEIRAIRAAQAQNTETLRELQRDVKAILKEACK